MSHVEISHLTNFLQMQDVILLTRSVLGVGKLTSNLYRGLLNITLKPNVLFVVLEADKKTVKISPDLLSYSSKGKRLKVAPCPNYQSVLASFEKSHPGIVALTICSDEKEALALKKFIALHNWSRTMKVIGYDGKFFAYAGDTPSSAPKMSAPAPKPHRSFCGQKVTLPSARPLGSATPDKGDTVSTGKGEKLKLSTLLGEGGEGKAFVTSKRDRVIKIMHPDKNTNRLQEKIKFMVNHPINNPFISWPIDSVHNSKGQFVGFIYPYVEGITLAKFVSQREDKKEGFGVFDVSKQELVGLILGILDIFNCLHQVNVLVGDIKLENFMLESKNGRIDPSRVHIVDCDSFQIDKFPATMTSVGYTAPELKDPSGIYRTLGEENYAIFVLLFMLLFKGKKPYDQIQKKTDYDDLEKARRGMFPYYSYRQKETEQACPKGYPPVCWSHLPHYVKNAFVTVGSSNCAHFAPEKRLSSKEWKEIFDRYYQHLTDGTLKKLDPGYNKGMFSVRDKPIDYEKVAINFEGKKVAPK